MSDHRKSIHQLKVEHDQDRELYGKPFVHRGSGEGYQLLFCAFDEGTNQKMAVYCLSAMPWLKFTRPFTEFVERFTQGHAHEMEEKK